MSAGLMKGTAGYRRRHTVRQALILVLLLLLIAGQILFARKIGGESIVLDTPDGELYDTKEEELRLAGLMRQYRVDAVLYHWKNSLHKDHEAAHKITDNAIFYASLATFEHPLPPAPIRRFMCAENWEDEPEFLPYYWFDVMLSFCFLLFLPAVRKAVGG